MTGKFHNYFFTLSIRKNNIFDITKKLFYLRQGYGHFQKGVTLITKMCHFKARVIGKADLGQFEKTILRRLYDMVKLIITYNFSQINHIS